jgi:membrane carboxypeptidase/penicillin-binding protein
MLAGLVQAPSADDPLIHFASARARQAHVLIRLIDTGTLTWRQASRAYQQPLHLTHRGPGGCPACWLPSAEPGTRSPSAALACPGR